jgi:hypothetical protein
MARSLYRNHPTAKSDKLKDVVMIGAQAPVSIEKNAASSGQPSSPTMSKFVRFVTAWMNCPIQ